MKKNIIIYITISIIFIIASMLVYYLNIPSKKFNNNNSKEIDLDYAVENFDIKINSLLNNNIISYQVFKSYTGQDKIIDSEIEVEVTCYYTLVDDTDSDVFTRVIKLNDKPVNEIIDPDGGRISNYNFTYRILSATGSYK